MFNRGADNLGTSPKDLVPAPSSFLLLHVYVCSLAVIVELKFCISATPHSLQSFTSIYAVYVIDFN